MKKSQKLSGLIIAVVAVLTFSGCGADSEIAEPDISTTSPSPVAAPTNESKSIFIATLLNGESFESQKVLENQPLALWFWAPG